MYKKILMIVISAVLVLALSGSVAAKEALSGRIELKGGSIIVGRIEEPSTISLKTRDGRIVIKVKDIISTIGGSDIGDSAFFLSKVNLKDGSVLEGVVEIRQVIIKPVWCERLEIKGRYIHSIWFFAEMPSTIKPGDSRWDLQLPLVSFYTTKGPQIKGVRKFGKEMHKILGASCSGRPSLMEMVEERLEEFKNYNSLLLIHPKGLKELKKVADKYPNLLPLSYAELKSYSFPLIVFSRDIWTDKIRGVIITDKLDVSLAKLLMENALSLDVPFRYENGQLQILNE